MVTNAPERIFAGYHHVHGHQKVWDTKSIGENGWQNVTEYIRADKVAALVEALELADAALSGANMNMAVVEMKVRAALAAFKDEDK